MAFTVRIIGVPVQKDLTNWVVDHVLWWPVDEWIGKASAERNAPVFRESVDSTLYLDQIGIFNKEEFVRLNEEYKAAFLADARRQPIHAEQQIRMKEVEVYLKQRTDIKWILVEQYEWES